MSILRITRTPKVALCECGCGHPSPKYPMTAKVPKYLLGTYKRFIHGHSRKGKGVGFSSRYVVDDATGCWVWQGAVGTHGYGVLSRDGKVVTAHKYSYLVHVGAVPEGALLLHECDNKLCVNPHHLHIGSHSRNIQEAWDRGLRNRQFNYSHLLEGDS